jgi:putative oxidoreductase
MDIGNLIIRISFGLLFVWGGLEKFFEGFLGGVGLQNMADFLKTTGWSFLGDSGTFALAVILSTLELFAGILLLANKKLFYSYTFLSFIMLVALLTVYIPSGNWMNIMIHIALFGSLLGLGLKQFKKEKTIWQ